MSALLLRRPALLLSATVAALASGCVMVPYGGRGAYSPYGGQVYSGPSSGGQAYGGQAYGDVVNVPPPAPQQEVIGVAPALGYLWITGYWGWNSGRHHWVPGYWSAPRQGHSWVPHRWERSGNGWRMNQGGWQRR